MRFFLNSRRSKFGNHHDLVDLLLVRLNKDIMESVMLKLLACFLVCRGTANVGAPVLSGWWPPALLFPCTPVCFVPPSRLSVTSPPCSFSRLFSSSSSSSAMKTVEDPSKLKYNSPGSLVKRSSTFSQFPTEKSKIFDFMNEGWVMKWHGADEDSGPVG